MLRKLQNGGFITILPPKMAINSNEIVTLGNSSELAIQICLKNLSSLNIKEVTKRQFHNDFTAKNGGFITILPPKTAISTIKIVKITSQSISILFGISKTIFKIFLT